MVMCTHDCDAKTQITISHGKTQQTKSCGFACKIYLLNTQASEKKPKIDNIPFHTFMPYIITTRRSGRLTRRMNEGSFFYARIMLNFDKDKWLFEKNFKSLD